METKRYMDETRLETWICAMTDYRDINGIIILNKAEVLWRLARGDFPYAKFNVTRIEYDKPEKFEEGENTTPQYYFIFYLYILILSL